MHCNAVIATMGPSIRNEDTIRRLLQEGMTAVRFNMSWGRLHEHAAAVEMVHKVATENGKFCAMCLDVSGTICQVVQPYTLREDGWPDYETKIVIQAGQDIILAQDPEAKLVVPSVRNHASYLSSAPVAHPHVSGSDNVNLTRECSLALITDTSCHACGRPVQDATEAVVLPVNQSALSEQVVPGSVLDIGRYLSPDEQEVSVRFDVLRCDPHTGNIHCKARWALPAASHLEI
jgi:hypothetical protein